MFCYNMWYNICTIRAISSKELSCVSITIFHAPFRSIYTRCGTVSQILSKYTAVMNGIEYGEDLKPNFQLL